ncbi:hypothetical protein CO181_04340 [candidate division WWE3 bacterium CG_4_9_14_3_um_filter_43_9]|uniref:Histidine kinase N-terminal 7TM region domain-containing protein n=2 Tax=Katanobacteria TaxID=422282 RepID=A0A2M7TDR5_UNCKA|nr:MAG: hypothetical protein COY34_00415 [candidate division WWE3 bacterium CG_4_10_14_0_2_um_filter_42_8]PJA37242.1 MAG: hypothetical protein CO181_04340 [candidate division WWE3 bacterium CG_4_9_14_3_um_filter_43_9]
MVPSNLSLGLTAIFLIGSGIWVLSSYFKQRNYILGYFSYFLLGIGGASAIWALGSFLVDKNPGITALSYPIGLLLGGIGITYFTRVGLNLIIPKYEKPIFWMFMAGNTISTLTMFFEVIVPERTAEGVVIWNISPTRGLWIVVIGVVITLFNLILFSLEAARVKNKILKIRAILIDLALVFYMGGGLAHNIVKTETQTILADVTTAFGAAILLVAVYLQTLSRKVGKSKS